MPSPLEITFGVLARSKDDHATDILVPALDSDEETVRRLAVEALIRRSAPRGQVELIRRFETFSEELKGLVQQNAGGMGGALRQCLTHGDSAQLWNALELVHVTRHHAQFPSVLALLNHDDDGPREFAREVCRGLVNDIYDGLNSHRDSRSSRGHTKHAPQLQQVALSNLGRICAELDGPDLPTEVIEDILILGDVTSPEVKRLLWQASPETREIAGELLKTSPHPGVMDLVLDSMSQRIPHPKALETLAERDDPEFVCYLLRRLPKRLSVIMQKNYRSIESMAWLTSAKCGLEAVPPGLQTFLIALIDALGLPADQKRSIQEWVLRHGGSAGRIAAADALNALDQGALHDAVLDSLESNDEEVQAWATSQLRTNGIPATFTLLIDRLDSASGVVRETARDELRDFDLSRVLSMYEHLSAATLVRVGELIQKIDPDSVAKLRREMANPIQRRRIQAARAAEAMKLQGEVLPALIAMSEDPDTLVRRTATEILGGAAHPDSVRRLKMLLEDPSQRVRESATRSLAEIESRLHERTPG